MSDVIQIFGLKKGTRLYRFTKKHEDVYKFYAYFTDLEKCPKDYWGYRCSDECPFVEVEVIEDIILLIVPYKTIHYIEDVSDEDRALAEELKNFAELRYSGEQLNCAKEAIDELILQERQTKNCSGNLDYNLAALVCDMGISGWIRKPLGFSVQDCIDEVMICNGDKNLRIIQKYIYSKKEKSLRVV